MQKNFPLLHKTHPVVPSLILQHSLKGENKDATSSSLIPEAERVAHILAMGYDVAPVNEASNKVVTGQSVSSTQRLRPR